MEERIEELKDLTSPELVEEVITEEEIVEEVITTETSEELPKLTTEEETAIDKELDALSGDMVSEEELRQMKWDYDIPSRFSDTIRDVLTVEDIPAADIEKIAKATIKAIEGHPHVLFLTDEQIKEEELYGYMQPAIVEAIVTNREGFTEEELKLQACKEAISQSYIDSSHFNDPDNADKLHDKIFKDAIDKSPGAKEAIHQKIISIYEDPKTDPKLKEAMEDDYRIVKQEYRDTLLYITRLSKHRGIISRMNSKRIKEESMISLKVLEEVYKTSKVQTNVVNMVKVLDGAFEWFLRFQEENSSRNYPINRHILQKIPMMIFIAIGKEKNLLVSNSAGFYDLCVKLTSLLNKVFDSEEVVAYLQEKEWTKESLSKENKIPRDLVEIMQANESYRYFTNIIMHCLHKFYWDALPINRK